MFSSGPSVAHLSTFQGIWVSPGLFLALQLFLLKGLINKQALNKLGNRRRRRRAEVWEWSRSLTLPRTSLRTQRLKENEEKKQVRTDPPSDAGQPGKKTQTNIYHAELICICIEHSGNTDKTLFIFQGNSGNISSNIRAQAQKGK